MFHEILKARADELALRDNKFVSHMFYLTCSTRIVGFNLQVLASRNYKLPNFAFSAGRDVIKSCSIVQLAVTTRTNGWNFINGCKIIDTTKVSVY